MSDATPPLVPDALLPGGVRDDRQKAFVHLLDATLSAIDIGALVTSDPMTVDAKLLPYLIVEYAAQDFIDPDFPEHVQRRLLQHMWALKSLKGPDAGVKLGLGLLGMSAVIEHWWQVEPKRPTNTHDLTFYIGEQLFPNGQMFFSEREKKAALRMIDVAKRWSQESTIYVGVALRPRSLRTAKHVGGISICRARMRVGQRSPRLPFALSTTQATRSTSVCRVRMQVGQRSPHLPLSLSATQATRSVSVTRLHLGIGEINYAH